MSTLFRFLKRNSPLFEAKYGAARRINEHYNKFLLDRYGIVKHYYTGNTEFAVIEADIRRLISE
jgi:glutathione peroxidase-family protein